MNDWIPSRNGTVKEYEPGQPRASEVRQESSIVRVSGTHHLPCKTSTTLHALTPNPVQNEGNRGLSESGPCRSLRSTWKGSRRAVNTEVYQASRLRQQTSGLSRTKTQHLGAKPPLAEFDIQQLETGCRIKVA